jgi:hypothetical protein
VSTSSSLAGARDGASTSRFARVAPWLLVLGGLVVVAILVGAPNQSDGEPFDPSSTTSNGTKALVELVESFGATVDVTSFVPSDRADVAVLFADALDDDDRARVDRWVRGGGTLVVTDPFSDFAPSVAGATGAFGVTPTLDADVCDIGELADLTVLDPGDAARYDASGSDATCFGDGNEAFVALDDLGEGRVVSVGGGDLFTNGRLGEADNAPLASRLLVPSGATDVAILQPGEEEGSGDRSLADVMALGTRLALVQLLAAFGVYAWFRARRLGAPVPEPQPVDIAGSELVLAVGQLLQQTKNPSRAAALLRADLRRRVGERLGLPVDMPAAAMAEVVVVRTAIDPHAVRQTMVDSPVATDAELLDLAQTIETVRQEILHDH